MPQGPIAVQQTPNITAGDASALYVQSTTVIKASPGTIVRVNVIVAGSAGGLYDCATTAGAITANEIAVTPATVGSYDIQFPCLVGITYKPGASQIVSISYN